MASSSPAPFQFPREYYFPAFFTRQTNLNTLHAQLVKWSSLVLSYCQHHRIFKLSLSPTSSTATATTSSSTSTSVPPSSSSNLNLNPASATATVDTEELFHNRKLNRRLALADVREVIGFMRREGRAEYVGREEEGRGEGDVVWVYWRTPEEWAGVIEGWVDETAQKGTVLTLYELTEGEGTRGTEFHGLDQELLQKALNVLVRRGKAQIFGQEDSQGVKFF
ncbi:hypothetical protein VMCG_03016 [Cytospora schulzeri]|uniref:ESCRT-II complex subunit VPS25 n=1 Tax=Cytospora schulzeri TaxID=448051 RepID=A0A423WXS4_9PEZI|nr:hypothetical protein VMCG_03016 [Valsa malicola]